MSTTDDYKEEPEAAEAQKVTRPRVEALDAILGEPLRVLDDGFVRVVDYMGADESIVQAARVSYGKGTKKVSQDRGLIRYLMRHRHTTPFEMADIKLHVRVPMDCWRQWIRHRTACLAEGTEIYFDLPSGIRRRGNQLYKLKIEDIWKRFQPTHNRHRPDKQRFPYFRRDRIRGMNLRQMDEDSLRIQHTRIVHVFKNGVKPVFRMTLEDGKQIETTADHRFFFKDGWKTLRDATGLHERNGLAIWDQGLHEVHVNGLVMEAPALYQDKEWLNDQYNVRYRKISDIAADCDVSYHTIRKWLAVHGIQHEKGGRSKTPWNKGKRYELGPRECSDEWLEAVRLARSGAASNFWRGGASSDREAVVRWTTQIAAKIHGRNGWTCQLCHERSHELHCHHIVPVWADPTRARDENNLTTLCASCHRNIAGSELDYVEVLGGPPVFAAWRKRPHKAWKKLTVARPVRIEKFEFVGEKMTYDLEVEGPHHNFIANGIVTHNSVNEYSTRYSIAIDAAQRTAPGEWRLQSALNKQGSEDSLDAAKGETLTHDEDALHNHLRHVYRERLEAGVAREQARKDLPLSTYTEAYWKINLHNLFHFLSLRMDDHAQLEIRQYATTIGYQVVRRWCPIAWEAFLDYRMDTMNLTRLDMQIVAALGEGDRERAVALATEFGWLKSGEKGLLRNRERGELETKLARLNLPIPWRD